MQLNTAGAEVQQELWGILLTYNLIRLEMARLADEVGLPPTRISFLVALRFIRDEWRALALSRSPGSFPQRLRRMRQKVLAYALPARRSQGRYPRAVKIKMSNYAKKRRKSARGAAK